LKNNEVEHVKSILKTDRTIDEIIKQIKWDPRLDERNFTVVYVDAMSPKGESEIRVSAIDKCSFKFMYVGDLMIPCRLVKEIKFKGKTVFRRKVS